MVAFANAVSRAKKTPGEVYVRWHFEYPYQAGVFVDVEKNAGGCFGRLKKKIETG